MAITLEDVSRKTIHPEAPIYSPYGYVVMSDGTTYALLYQYFHGVILALLYPEQAKEAGYDFPDDIHGINPYTFQKFELDNHNLFPVIRVCSSRMLGPTSIDRGCDPTTPSQIVAMRDIIKILCLKPNSIVSTDHKDITVRKMWDFLSSDLDVWNPELPRNVLKHRVVKKDEDFIDVMKETTVETLPKSFEQREGVSK